MNFETWYAITKNMRAFQDEYMEYFYNWEGWNTKTNQDPLSYRAWMKNKFKA